MSPIQVVTDAAELALAADIRDRLLLIPPLLADAERRQQATGQRRSQAVADDQVTAWMQLSHSVLNCMNMAADNLRALHALLLPDGMSLTVYQFAQYPLLRAALEASSHALWLVAPATQKERVLRLLQTRAAEVAHDYSLNKTLSKVDATALVEERRLAAKAAKLGEAKRTKHLKKLGEIADNAGIPHQDFERLPGYGEIVAAAAKVSNLQGRYGTMVWQVLSGLSHPSTSRSVNFSTLERLSESVDGVTHNMLTADLRWVQIGLMATLANYMEADARIRARMITPANGV